MRLIDADMFEESLKQAQNECRHKEGGNFLFGFLSKVRANLEKMPTVDAAPVIHARWIESDFVYTDTYYKCSNCGEAWVLNDGTPVENNMNYCPRCGARMDGEEDG